MRKSILNYFKNSDHQIILKGLSLFLIIFVVLYFKFPLFFLPQTFVTIRLEDVLILLCMLYWVWYLIASGNIRKLIQDRYFQIIAVFIIIGFLATFIGAFGLHTIDIKMGLYHWGRRIEYLFFFLIAYSLRFSFKEMTFVTKTLIFISLVVSIYALGQKYLGFYTISTINSVLSQGLAYTLVPGDRVNSTFSGHYDLAAFLLMIIPLGLVFITYYLNRYGKNIIMKRSKLFLVIYYFLVTMLAFFVLVLTAARLSFLAAIISILFFFIVLRKWRYLALSLLAFVLILVYPSQLQRRLISTVRVNIQRSFSEYKSTSVVQQTRSLLNIPTLPADNKRIETQGEGAADIVPGEPINQTDLGVFRSFEIRIKVEWPRAIRAFKVNPITGSGYGSLGLATDNDLLRLLGEVGVVGTIVFIILIVNIVRDLVKKIIIETKFKKYLYVGYLSLVVGFIINSLFIDVFEASKLASVFWFLTGMISGLDVTNKS